MHCETLNCKLQTCHSILYTALGHDYLRLWPAGEDDQGLLHDTDILDMDKAELLLGGNMDIFSSSEEGEGPQECPPR